MVGLPGRSQAEGQTQGARALLRRREGMMRVAVRDLASGAQAAVECGALVQAVALYAERLAVQLAAQVLVYAVPAGCSEGGLSLHLHVRIGAALPCSLLLVAAHHLLLCQVRSCQAQPMHSMTAAIREKGAGPELDRIMHKSEESVTYDCEGL